MRSYKPDEVKDLFSDYVGSDLVLKIEGKEYKLNMRVNDLAKVMSASAASANGQISEDNVSTIGNAMTQIFFRTFLPHWNEVKDCELADLTVAQTAEQDKIRGSLNNFIIKNYDKIFTALAKELGWITPTDAKKVDENLAKLKASGSPPQQ